MEPYTTRWENVVEKKVSRHNILITRSLVSETIVEKSEIKIGIDPVQDQ